MIQILGWTILHSLWQIALIASIYLLLKHSLQAATALKKYYLAVASLVTTFLSTIFTFSCLYQQKNWTVATITDSTLTPITSETPTTILVPITPTEIIVETTLSFADYLTICLPYLVAFWGMGMLYFTIRFLKSLYGVKQLQNIDNELISKEWLTKIATFKNQLDIQKEIQVFLSLQVKEPITFGHFKPIILLPISLITGFDTAAIETILLHELAHIKRHDYLVNLGQSIIEIILFYHPLVWWLSKDIRELREHCCDDLVLSLGDNRATYVETLTALQWRKVGGVTNRLSLSASGGDAGFTRRIKRMFGVEEKRGSFRQLMGVFLVLLVLALGGIWLKNELGSSAKTTMDYTFIVHENTTFGELNELTEKMRDLGIYKSFCWSGYYDEITSINGAYYDADRNIQYFDITDIRKTPTRFIFENGFITDISDLPHQSIQLKSAKDASILINDKIRKEGELRREDASFYTILINEKTTKEELTRWTKMVIDQGNHLDFNQTVFDEDGKVIELKGNYNSGDKEGNFFAADLPCVNVTIELYKDQLSEPVFSYPCREKSTGQVDVKSMSVDDLSDRFIKKENGQIYWIDGNTLGNDEEKVIAELSALEIFDGFSFNPETNSFNGNYFYEKGKTNFIEVEDVTKRPIKIVIKNGYVAELKITGDTKDGIGFIRNEFLEKTFQHPFSTINVGNTTDTLVYLVSNEMTRIELYEMIAKIKAHSQVQINLDPLKTEFDAQDKLVAISGKYYYERPTRRPIQTFEVADLGQFQLQFRSHPNFSFAPAYYNIATKEFIQVTDHYSAFQVFANKSMLTGNPLTLATPNTYKEIYAILVINESTNMEDLKAFAEKILPNNIIFRYQDSKFRPDGTIAKLVGDFLGNSRMSEPFYVDDLTKYQVKLRVDKGYIYQPEITSIAKKELSSRTDNSLKQDYEIGLLQAKNEKERIVWREKLAALEISRERFKPKGYINFKPNFLNEKTNVETKKSGLSYKITNRKALNLDSLEYSLANETHRNYGNSIAKLIPSYVAVDDSVKAMNPIYRNGFSKNIKPVYVNTSLLSTPEVIAYKIPSKLKEIPNAEKIVVSNERNKRLPTIGMNSPNRVHWDNLEFEVEATVKDSGNEEKTIQISTLEITQAQWDRLQDQPFSLDFNNTWYTVKTVKGIVHVPFKKDPSSARLHESYIQIIKDKNHRATKLLMKAKVNDYIYFEQIGVGENFTFGMAVKIVENQPKHSMGYINHVNELIDNAENPNSEDFQAPNFGDAKISAEHIMRLPIETGNTQNWIYWGEKKIEWDAIKIDNGSISKQLQSKVLFIQQKDWEVIFDKQLTLYYDGHYYNSPDFEHIILEKDGVLLKGAELVKPYNQEIQDKDNFTFRLLKDAKIGEQITLQKMRLGKYLFCDLVVRIIDNQLAKSTEFTSKENVQFQDLTFKYSEEYRKKTIFEEGLRINKIRKAFIANPPSINKLNQKGISTAYFVNGVKYDKTWMKEISPNAIDSIKVVNGTHAKILYGVDSVVLITTYK